MLWKKGFAVAAGTGLMLFAPMARAQEAAELEELTAEEQAYVDWATSFVEGLDYQTGTIEVGDAIATLQIPDDFYYLSPTDARKVLEEAWGNPPNEFTLGMIFPAHSTPLEATSWGVNIFYEEEGYVSDEDAAGLNYDELLQTMKEDTLAESEARVAEGYQAIELVGWAAAPLYDEAANKLYWAKELRFGENETNTLNYNIRVLGRRGVLVLNFIADMPQLDEINANLPTVLAMAEFNDGMRYADFDPDIDTVAAYGIGGLVAGKVLAKTGFLAVAFAFLKKFGILIVAAVGAFFARLFRRKKEPAA